MICSVQTYCIIKFYDCINRLLANPFSYSHNDIIILSVINFDGRWTLIGITSAGFGCAVEKQPGIYHKVSKTARWIAHMIRKP